MIWYRGWYGSWKEPGGVQSIGGDYNRKTIFDRAQKIANNTGKIVTIAKEIPTGCGVKNVLYKVNPQ